MKLTNENINRIIEMAWEDRTPIDAIKKQFSLNERQIITHQNSKIFNENEMILIENETFSIQNSRILIKKIKDNVWFT